MQPFDGEMLAFVPPSLMELRWADDVLRFELEPDGAGCILRLRVTFPEHGKAARDAAGWHVCLERLVTHLRRRRAAPANRPQRWQFVHRAYVERLGPEASAVGPPGGPVTDEAHRAGSGETVSRSTDLCRPAGRRRFQGPRA